MTGILQGLIGSYLGKSTINLVISANTSAYDVYANRGPSYVAGSDITVTINPGVTVSSTAAGPGNYALLVPSQFSPLDTITIVNNGSVLGIGGAGGAGGDAYSGAPPGSTGKYANPGNAGEAGGNGVYVNRPTIITNNGTIAGGGGGGGGGGGAYVIHNTPGIWKIAGGGGGGAGAGNNTGGNGGTAFFGYPTPRPSAQLALAPGSSGGPSPSSQAGGGGSGGYAFTGQPGTPWALGGSGGSGGAFGADGGAGQASTMLRPGPPTPGNFPGETAPGGGGGTAGYYIVGNPFVTWPVTGTRQGNVG